MLHGLPLLAVLTLPPVSFRHDVMAVLSRGGCNMGACHGNQNGKNGFRLSLRGEDADFDLYSLTRDMHGRRVNPLDPSASLLLAKATGSLPHEGGKRFDTQSAEYAILRRWIQAGAVDDPPETPTLRRLLVAPTERTLYAPEKSVTLQIEALYSDGKRRDVRGLAVYESSSNIATVSGAGVVSASASGETTILVRYLDQQAAVRLAFVPARPNFTWKSPPEVNFIDRHVFARLRELRLQPSDLCSDSVFLRRAYLDVLGVLPTADEVRAFLKDDRPDKRTRLIDQLVLRPEFADFWALKWSDLLRNEEKTLDAHGVRVFHGWIRRAIAEGKPLNEFARELIAARGSTYSHPAANYYRALRDPHIRAETTAQVFLGVRLQCARCHNHPFDSWKQDDYHSLAAFFARVDYRIVENQRRDRLDKHEFVGEQIVLVNRVGEVKHPRTGQPTTARFLGGSVPRLDGADRLQALADWIADAKNPFFARAQANRVWHHLMGRGIVEPNDDFRASNPPVNPALLDALARELAEHQFDLRHLVKTILKSRTYQLSATWNDTNRDDENNFARAVIRPLQAEQLLDALVHVTGAAIEFDGQPKGTRAGQLPGSRAPSRRDQKLSDADRFLLQFGKPVRSLTCECERSEETTLGQAFLMLGGRLLDELLTRPDNRLGRLIDTGRSDADIVEELFLVGLCRRPTANDLRSALAQLRKTKSRRQGLEDLLWGIVNSKEFLLRQ